MTSIRTKITAMTMFIVVLTMAAATIFDVTAIRDIGTRSAERRLELLCETGQKNLNHYFDSVEQSVEMLSVRFAWVRKSNRFITLTLVSKASLIT